MSNASLDDEEQTMLSKKGQAEESPAKNPRWNFQKNQLQKLHCWKFHCICGLLRNFKMFGKDLQKPAPKSFRVFLAVAPCSS